MSEKTVPLPEEHPVLRVTTQPNDANPKGDIFGGWLMSQIDIAGAIMATDYTNGPVATVAVKDLHFIQPIYVHDLVSFYGKVVSVGNTSITIAVEVYSQRQRRYSVEAVKVSSATLVYVAINEPGQKRQIIAGTKSVAR